MVVKVLCEPVVTSRSDVKHTNAALSNALPKPFGVEDTTTRFSKYH